MDFLLKHRIMLNQYGDNNSDTYDVDTLDVHIFFIENTDAAKNNLIESIVIKKFTSAYKYQNGYEDGKVEYFPYIDKWDDQLPNLKNYIAIVFNLYNVLNTGENEDLEGELIEDSNGYINSPMYKAILDDYFFKEVNLTSNIDAENIESMFM